VNTAFNSRTSRCSGLLLLLLAEQRDGLLLYTPCTGWTSPDATQNSLPRVMLMWP